MTDNKTFLRPYRIEIDNEGCTHCGHNKTWAVIQPDGILLGTTYGIEEDAQDMADELNDAYEAGTGDLLNTIQLTYRKHCLGDDTIGWHELSTALLNTLCNVMGDKAFNEWVKQYSNLEDEE
ncbi:MAG TPA: hypothetical protein VFG06_06070 [Thermodesulfovibrionales bacterium]|nr:hypothetical protein [Thermodesulfovibrionales bacterium]